MNLLEAINIRTSRRKYLDEPLLPAQVEKLQTLINEYNQIGGFRIELIQNNGAAFAGFTRSYGMLSGVRHYLSFIADVVDLDADEKIGYYGELLVLHATAIGLGTCWIGGTFAKSKTPFTLANSERLACLITIGSVPETPFGKEKFIYKLTHRKTKVITDMYTADETPPPWFIEGMTAVAKAPSAMNKQPVSFVLSEGTVKASVPKISKYLVAFDLGIAKLHFELGAGGGAWQWGNGAHFKPIEH